MTPQEWLNYYDNEYSADDGREHLEIGEALEIIRELVEDVKVLTWCLNGSTKAKYTAELYDKGMVAARRQGMLFAAELAESEYDAWDAAMAIREAASW